MASKHALSRVVLLGTTTLLLTYVTCIGIRNVFRYNTFNIDYELARQHLKAAQEKNAMLKRRLAQLSDDAYWVLQAKEMGYVSKGEVVYKLSPQEYGVDK